MASDDLVARSGDLKRLLVKYVQRPRFVSRVRKELRREFGQKVPSESDLVDFFDGFLLRHKLDDGRTVLERFVEEHPELPKAERDMLLGWRDIVEGIFQVRRQDGPALVVVNLIDDLTYRVRSNMGPGVFSRVPEGAFLVTRLVPVQDEWLLSGASSMLSPDDREAAYRSAAEVAMERPAAVFRNPEKVRQARELQEGQHREFVACFGDDVVVVPGNQMAERMKEYLRFCLYEARGEDGLTTAERAKAVYGHVPTLPEQAWPDHLLRAKTVGVIYDVESGLHYLADFGTLDEAFANPELARDREHREAVLGYLQEPSIPPLAFRRLARRHPGNASRVFQIVLQQPDFSWERDGEALLRRYKAEYFDRPPRPSVLPLSGELARARFGLGRPGRSSPPPPARPTKRKPDRKRRPR